jgi:hypothetical protein
MADESTIPENTKPSKRFVQRDAYICKYCEGVYADEPVSSCDCLEHLGKNPPHFIKGKIEYILTN